MKNILTLFAMTSCLCLAAGQAPAAETKDLAELGTMQKALVSAGLGSEVERYHARSEGEGFLLASPAQGLTALLGQAGIEVKGANGAVGMRLVGWGCEAALTPVTGWQATAEANRVEFSRKGITEWYIAGPLGVEQGFTVAAPAAGCEAAGELVVELAVESPAVLGKDGRSLDFPEAGLRYGGLVSVDATGRELSAQLDLGGKRLAIHTEVTNARWPVTVDPTFEIAKLLGDDGDAFGLAWSIAVSGTTVVLGAPGSTENGTNSGSAYVFTEPPGGWTGTVNQVAKLLASDGTAHDLFGSTVAISGSTVVVGAIYDDDACPADLSCDSGSVYVFEEPVGGWAGTLNESAKLLASDGAEGAQLSQAVAISGSTVVAGASTGPVMDSLHPGGVAYVFAEPAGGWAGTLNEAAKLVPLNSPAGDGFGQSVAVSGGTVVVGAAGTYFGGGGVFVFIEPAGGWSGTLNQVALLVASSGSTGRSVAISGSTVVAGGGAATKVFTEPTGGWSGTLSEAAKLVPSDTGAQFGEAVAISDRVVVVGDWLQRGPAQGSGRGSGSAYVYTEPVGGWTGTLTEVSKLQTSGGVDDDEFGQSVAVSGSTIIVAAPFDQPGAASGNGSAYVFPAPCSAPGGDDLTLMDDTVLDTQFYHVCDTITVGPNYAVSGPNGNLNLRSRSVVFLDDSSVTVDGTLTVRND